MTMSLAEMDLLDDSLTPCWISIFLSMALPEASVDHEYIGGAHRFIVQRDGAMHEVNLAQSVLSEMDADEFLWMLENVADRILADAGSGTITICSKASDELQAV
jgi:hypothetical protein